MTLTFAPQTAQSTALHIVSKEQLRPFTDALAPTEKRWVEASTFKAASGSVLVVPGPDGAAAFALVGHGDSAGRKRARFSFASARAKLPEGTYHIESGLSATELEEAVTGWLFAGYTFDRYKDQPAPKAMLVAPKGVNAPRLEAIAAGEALTRDLINTPASDMGPNNLEDAAQELAAGFGASCTITRGDDLLAGNLPMIHAVGRASSQAPRLIDIRWGDAGPTLTLVGKGVCFDTGGLNLKPGGSMGLMKKDMGGAATVLGLARMIMSLNLTLQLRVLIPAVENAVSANAFRPQDILNSRKGLTVEVNNTDAEGRLVLADALALADEEMPDLLVSMATLTGAARVAVGPDLAPFYSTDGGVSAALKTGGETARDPVWEMPFWEPYETMIEPGIADLDNAPKGGFAGSITAALFLRRFVTDTARYAHFDIYGWQPTAAPARPKGGVGQGARAILDALPEILAL